MPKPCHLDMEGPIYLCDPNQLTYKSGIKPFKLYLEGCCKIQENILKSFDPARLITRMFLLCSSLIAVSHSVLCIMAAGGDEHLYLGN